MISEYEEEQQPSQLATMQQPEHLILCCSCGTSIPPNPVNMCMNCVRSQVDISEGIPKQLSVSWCRNCERYLQPPNAWITAQPESRELMALLLRKLKGLNRVRLIDASFIWTEPHSRRIKIKLTVQKEIFTSAILQHVFQVEIVMAGMQCLDCTRVMAQDTWKAVVQLRQKVAHKRTFFFLEQLILKYQAHKDTINIKECKDGLDFYFGHRSHALTFLQFLQTVVPVRHSASQQLISSDIKSGTANFKFTYSAEIIPLCKDDLIVLPLKLARQCGNINPLVLCHKISGGSVSVLDPRTLQISEVQATPYWRDPFGSLCEAGAGASGGRMSEYYVLDVELLGEQHGRMALADITVARCFKNGGKKDYLNENDLDVDMSTTFITRSHLGNILKEGDYVYGYDLHSTNFNSDLYDELLRVSQGAGGYHQIPDVLLVKKLYFSTKKRSRPWRVKRIAEGMEVERDETMNKKGERESTEKQWEDFLCEIERDKDMRGMMNLYRDPRVTHEQSGSADEPQVDLAELLDDLQIDDQAMPDAA